ncbi:conserved hypothetical protein [Talaromyces stipitatus ATCC 10500]|uniref:Uncharacterized protein n=1 Tax=Talaromyces stipitatus (strain ATCC 10500 / CBS 375.48 / QM 6759 / NRRL 1006) TaxID=441959 RepID=B8MG37_TALSN|nr:uncharacterized protein TSTA_010220 [Talaromyces stipitatus ATCC 10500]EED15904.1 conserved hypothetical protein [Talaromyces stipitatus ATCC 10500]
MRLFELRILPTAKVVIITLASTFISLFLVLLYLQHIVKNDVISFLTFDFPFPNRPAFQEPTFDNNTANSHEEGVTLDIYDYDVELVVASLKEQNTSWYSTYFPDWKSNIYIVDDSTAPLTVPQNKGHEAMVYLTYIIDRYDTLPNNTLFLHAERFQWHNDNPDYDGYPLLRDFQFTYLQEEGYINLRCVWTIGCPEAIHPLKDQTVSEQHEGQATGKIFRQVFEELLPDYPVPGEVGVSCCAQFAVTKEVIQQRPKEDYIRFREWLLATTFQDGLSGRFFEYSWHIIFGKDPVYCPSAADCYCKVYGMCHLSNCSEDECDGQYFLPTYSTLPPGWPRVGWNGEERFFSGPL